MSLHAPERERGWGPSLKALRGHPASREQVGLPMSQVLAEDPGQRRLLLTGQQAVRVCTGGPCPQVPQAHEEPGLGNTSFSRESAEACPSLPTRDSTGLLFVGGWGRGTLCPRRSADAPARLPRPLRRRQRKAGVCGDSASTHVPALSCAHDSDRLPSSTGHSAYRGGGGGSARCSA